MPPEPIVSYEIAKWLKEHGMPQHREFYHYKSDRELHDGIPTSIEEKYDGATYSSVCHWFRLNRYAVVPVSGNYLETGFYETRWNIYRCLVYKDINGEFVVAYDSNNDNIIGTYEEMQLVGIQKIIKDLWKC